MKKLVLFGALALVLATTGVANAALTWRTDLSGTWIDTVANPLNLSDDGEVNINSTVGNSVFGAGTLRVGSNGGVRFAGAGTQLSFVNQPIPSGSNFSLTSQVLDVFWDDINTNSGQNGNIYWDVVNGGDTLVVSWVGVDFFDGGTDAVDFQLQVHATGTGTGLAQFLYQDTIEGGRADGGGSATIGYQAGGIENDAQFSFNTSGSVGGGTVLTLVPEPTSLLLLGIGGLALIRRR